MKDKMRIAARWFISFALVSIIYRDTKSVALCLFCIAMFIYTELNTILRKQDKEPHQQQHVINKGFMDIIESHRISISSITQSLQAVLKIFKSGEQNVESKRK